jgi:5-methyltetrahydropteroyltriglutamate--homocysteine methyltransferase
VRTTTSTYRADHVGSLLRPPELVQAREAYGEGRLRAGELRALEDRAILDALQLQREVGLDVFTDGEYRRASFMSNMAEAVEGFKPVRVELEWRGPAGDWPGGFVHSVGGKLRQTGRLTAHEVPFVKEHAPGPIKITVPSPALFVPQHDAHGVIGRDYATRSALLADLTAIVATETRALAAEGVPYVQVDAPGYMSFVDQRTVERMRQGGLDPDQELAEAIAADNACLAAARHDGGTTAIHFCRGNSRSRWLREGGYDPIAERLFTSLDADRFLLEYDTDRAGGFEPLRFVPRGKFVVLGLVTTKQGQLESQDELRQRIDEAAKYVPLENLALSPQCGFASSFPGNLLSLDDQRRKLELVVDTARKVWG